MTYARLRPIRSPTLLPIRMNAADTSASSAIAAWMELTVVSRSSTTAEIDTFISDVSNTSTNIAIASRMASARSNVTSAVVVASSLIRVFSSSRSLSGAAGRFQGRFDSSR
jgi:hypothetical protein